MGARVTAHYNTQSAPLEPLVAEFGTDRVRALQADLTREDDVARLFDAAAAAPFGPVQVAVINHAYYEARDVPLAEMSLEQWEGTFRTNLTSSFLVARAFLRALKSATEEAREKAAIVLIGSTAGKMGEIGHADYAATKSGQCELPDAERRFFVCSSRGADFLVMRSDDVRDVPQLEERDRAHRAEGESERRRARCDFRTAIRGEGSWTSGR